MNNDFNIANYYKLIKDNPKLLILLGNDYNGNIYSTDLSISKNLLLVGSSKSNKSVFLNSLIYGFIKTKGSLDIKFNLIDSKYFEFSQYDKIPYLMYPPAKEIRDVLNILGWCLYEIKRRKALKSKSYYPKIITIIDEYSEYMEYNYSRSSIIEIVRNGWEVGIHLILSTSNVSISSLPSELLNSFPLVLVSHLNLEYGSQRVLWDVMARYLKEDGDTYVRDRILSKTIRIKTPYVPYEDIFELAIKLVPSRKKEAHKILREESVMYSKIKKLVIQEGYSSNTHIQKKLKISSNTIVEKVLLRLEKEGIISEVY